MVTNTAISTFSLFFASQFFVMIPRIYLSFTGFDDGETKMNNTINRYLLAGTVTAILIVTGCGQKGDLYLPPEEVTQHSSTNSRPVL